MRNPHCELVSHLKLSVILQGLPTIRAYAAGERFRAAFLAELDGNGAWWFAYISTARWCA